MAFHENGKNNLGCINLPCRIIRWTCILLWIHVNYNTDKQAFVIQLFMEIPTLRSQQKIGIGTTGLP